MGCGWEGLCLEMCMFGQISVWGWCLHGVSVSTKNLVIIHFCHTYFSKGLSFLCITFCIYNAHKLMCLQEQDSGGSRIFPSGGCQLPKWVCEPIFLAENCMKMKEFGPPGGGACVPGAPLRSATARSTKTPLNPLCTSKNTHTPILKITYNIQIKKKILLYSKKIILENILRLGSGELGAEVVT